MSGTVANITVEPCLVLWGGTDLGYTEGDLTLKLSEKMHALKAHQTGSNEIGAIRTGKSAEITVVLQETTIAQLTSILVAGGKLATAVAEVSSVTFVADVAGSLNSKYFTVQKADDGTKNYVWFNINSAGVDPAPSGYTAVPVTGATGATATTLAAAAATALTSAGYTASASSGVLTITNAATGGATDTADSAAATGFTFSTTTQGLDAVPGWGDSRDFTEVTADCKALTLHPVVNASTDQTRDLHCWKAYPELDSIKHSGENPLAVSVKFKIFPDYNRAASIRWFVLGKHY